MASVYLSYIISSSGFICFLTFHYLLKLYALASHSKIEFFYKRLYNPSITLVEPSTVFDFWIVNILLVATLKVHKKSWLSHEQMCFFYLMGSALLLLFFLVYCVLNTKNPHETNIILLILIFLYLFLASFRLIPNVMSLIMGLELLSVSYYYYFVFQSQKNYVNFIQLKNLLSFYLWLSFLTFALLVLTTFTIYFFIGTGNFKEMQMLNRHVSGFWWALLVSSLLWKLGAPGFHFFKLELYKYLSLFFLVFFSIITLYINCFILSFLGSVFAPILKFSGLWLLIIIMFFNIFLLQQGLTNLKFYQFIALSSVNSLSFCLLLFFI